MNKVPKPKKNKKNKKNNLRIKTALLILQILLPFGLYFALELTILPAAWLIGGMIAISMAAQVRLG